MFCAKIPWQICYTEELLEGTIEVINSAIIKSVSAGSSYDHTGEYIYLAIGADYLDPSYIPPEYVLC